MYFVYFASNCWNLAFTRVLCFISESFLQPGGGSEVTCPVRLPFSGRGSVAGGMPVKRAAGVQGGLSEACRATLKWSHPNQDSSEKEN